MISKRRKKEPYLSPSLVLNECRISSAVSTVLRRQKFAIGDVAGAEHFGCGDLRQAASAVGVWGLKSACRELRQPIGYVRIRGDLCHADLCHADLDIGRRRQQQIPIGN